MSIHLESETQLSVTVFAYCCGSETDHTLDRRLVSLLSEANLDPTVVLCNGILKKSCPVMFADGVSTSNSLVKKLTCARCKLKSKRWQQDQQNIRFITIESLLQTKYRSARAVRLAIRHMVYKLREDTALYRKLLYNDLLRVKCDIRTLEQEHQSSIQRSLESSSVMKLALEAGIPRQTVLVHNALYGTNAMIWDFAQANTLDICSYYGSFNPVDRTRLVHIERVALPQLDQLKLGVWRHLRDNVLSHASTKRVTDFLKLGLTVNRSFQFSKPPATGRDVLEKFQIDHSTRVVLALFSSPDETISAFEVGVFCPPNPAKVRSAPLDFLRLVMDVARALPDKLFIVRLHPRMGRTARERPESSYLGEIVSLLSAAPSNVLINEPSDEISLFDVAQFADVALSMGTTAAIQIGAMGVPIVNCSPDFGAPYPLDLYEDIATDPLSLAEILGRVSRFSDIALVTRRFRFLDYYLSGRGVRLVPDEEVDEHWHIDDSGYPLSSLKSRIAVTIRQKLRDAVYLKLVLLLIREIAIEPQNTKCGSSLESQDMVRNMILQKTTLDEQLLTVNRHNSDDVDGTDTEHVSLAVNELRDLAGWKVHYPKV